MRKLVAAVLLIGGLGAIGLGAWRYAANRRPNAGLKVETNPSSLVFVDNVQIGPTPIEKIFRPGEVGLKLIPNSTASALTTYQTKVRLTSQTFTVVRRDFGASDSESAGEIVSLEPQSGKVASLAVVTSSPDSAAVSLDGAPQGFSPLFVAAIGAGDHQISVSAPGFTPRQIPAKAVVGYKLNVNVKLAGEPLPAVEPGPLPSPTPRGGTPATTLKKPYVEIKDTPTGFLRVRSQATTGSSELGRVTPGDRYPLLDQAGAWYLIKVDLEATSSGWVSAQYADKFE